MTVKYTPGAQLKIADALSRSPEATSVSPEIADIECQVHLVTSNHPISNEKLEEFKTATLSDATLQKVKNYIMEGWPLKHGDIPKDLSEYWQHRDILTCENDLIYRGEKLLVPKSMRKLVLHHIHEGHLGIGKCIARGKTYFFWPYMLNDIRDVVEKCGTCQEHRNAQPKQPNLSRTASWSHKLGKRVSSLPPNVESKLQN